LADKLNLKNPRPSDWFALASSNEIEFIETALDGDAVLVMSGRWHEAVQEPEMGNSIGVKMSKERQNITSFDLDRPWSHY
jgi:hypothetical protein